MCFSSGLTPDSGCCVVCVSGGELMQHIYNKRQLSEEETRKYMRQMVSAVDHMHRAGIIHR